MSDGDGKIVSSGVHELVGTSKGRDAVADELASSVEDELSIERIEKVYR